MPKTLVNQNLGGTGTPQEVKDLRKSSYDLHDELGFPVVFKHRWNLQDVQEGRTRLCPFHDELYGNRDTEWDAICFGTGFVGGYADGQIVYVTIQDAAQDVIRVTPQGLLQMDTHPNVTAPWLPLLGDGDLLFLADFSPGTWNILDLHERYELREVTPITMRGPGWGRQQGTVSSRYRISQQAQADRLPAGHALYNVPVVFDYSDVPPDPTPPYSPTPPEGYTYTSTEYSVKVRGGEGVPSPVPPSLPTSSKEVGVRIKGDDAGTFINF